MAGRPDLAAQFRAHFGDEDHLYAVLLRALADDWTAGGVARTIFAGREDDDPRQMLQLRMLAGLHRLVLRGDAPELVAFYPSLGGTTVPADAWPVVEPVLAAHVEELRAALDEAPQTNEPGRTVALLIGLTEAVRRTGLRRIRLLEPGASAGLGLLVDRYRFVGDGWAAGPVDSPLVIDDCAAMGFAPQPYEIVVRRGCDLAPVDATSPEGAAYLTAFVWPWMTQRHRRLQGALEVAREHPVVVDQAPASWWLAQQLAEPVDPDVLTVVWHSVTRLYWPADEVAAVEALIDQARRRMPLAHLALEHPIARPGTSAVDALPVLELDAERIAECDHHGPPVTLIGSR